MTRGIGETGRRRAVLQVLRASRTPLSIVTIAQELAVHPNTVRYRVRRIEKLLSTSLADPDVRLLFSLALRVLEGP